MGIMKEPGRRREDEAKVLFLQYPFPPSSLPPFNYVNSKNNKSY